MGKYTNLTNEGGTWAPGMGVSATYDEETLTATFTVTKGNVLTDIQDVNIGPNFDFNAMA